MTIPEQFVIRDQRRFGWFSLDNEIIDDHGGQIGAYGVAVYCVISRHSRDQVAKLSQRDIAASLRISQDRVRKSLADLVDLHLVHVDVPERAGPGLITRITLLNVKPTERHTFSSAAELNATRSRNKEVKTKTETETAPLFCWKVLILNFRARARETNAIPRPISMNGISASWGMRSRRSN